MCDCQIDLSEMKDKTMVEFGVDVTMNLKSFNRAFTDPNDLDTNQPADSAPVCTTTAHDVGTCTPTTHVASTGTTTAHDVPTCTTTAPEVSTCTATAQGVPTCTIPVDSVSTCTTTTHDVPTCTTTAHGASTCTTTAHGASTCTTTAHDVSTCTTTAHDVSTCTTTANGVSTCTTPVHSESTCTMTANDVSTCTTSVPDVSTCTTPTHGVSTCTTTDDVSTHTTPAPVSSHYLSKWEQEIVFERFLKSQKCTKPETCIKPETCYVGLVNQAMTCYLNSLLQALYMTPEFRNALYNWEYVEGSEKDEANSIPYQLQKLFLNLQTSTKSAVETTALTKSFGWDSTEVWQQHDIQELCRVMFDALEQKFKNTKQADLINRLYEGKMIDYVKCLECGTEKSREDTFLDIPLPVRSFGSKVAYNSVEEALRAFVQYETLEGNNQYFCEKCNKKCDAHKGLKFTKFPYFLTLHLKRFDFDFKTFNRIKLNDKVTFPDVLNLNHFISLKTNQESPDNDENTNLVKHDDSSTTDDGILGDGYLPSENNFPNTNHSTNQDLDDDEGVDISNGALTSNCTIHNNDNEHNCDDSSAKGPYKYELFSIMIHSGSASGGHYYAYIKDFRTQEWFSFNDQSVTQIMHEDIQKTYGGNSNRPYYRYGYSGTTAYMLMYRQIDPVRNALPIQVKDFPKHIQELLKKMEEANGQEEANGHEANGQEEANGHDANGQEANVQVPECIDMKRYRDKCRSTFTVDIYCYHPVEGQITAKKMIHPNRVTWAEVTEDCYKCLRLEGIVDLNQCRLVSYDHVNKIIIASYEGIEDQTFGRILGKPLHSLLLEIRDKDEKFEPLLQGITTKVYVVDVSKKEIIDGPYAVRSIRAQTVNECKKIVGDIVNINPDEMGLVVRQYDPRIIFVENDADLQAARISDVFVLTMFDTEVKSLYDTVINDIIETSEYIITLHVKLPDDSNNEIWELIIPSVEEKHTDKKQSVTDSPFKVSVKRKVPKRGKKKMGVREYNSPELLNLMDDVSEGGGSCSDSDETLFKTTTEDVYTRMHSATDTVNQVDFENTLNATDDIEYYFKAKPYLNNKQKFLRILVDNRMEFSTLKQKLEPYVGVPAAYFKIFRYDKDLEVTECDCLWKQLYTCNDGEKFYIKFGRALRNGEFTVKLYQFLIDSPGPYKFLGEWIVSNDMTVGQAKKEILAEIKHKFDIDIPFERCRLRKNIFGRATKVLLDDQKVEELRCFIRCELFIQELPCKEPVTYSDEVVLFVRRWFPSQMQLGPVQEIVTDGKAIKQMLKELSVISGIPVEHIVIATAKGLFPHKLCTSLIELESTWFGNEFDALLHFVKDGSVFLYKDNRETLKNVSCEESNGTMIQDVHRYVSHSSSRKDKPLKIYMDAK